MKKISTLLFLFFLAFGAFAQQYYSGIGLRVGKFNTGISYKHFMNSDNATGLQLDAYYSNVASGGNTIKGFVIQQTRVKIPIIQLPLDFIYGAGVNVGYFPFEAQGYYKRQKKEANYYSKSVVSAGVDLTVQIEYKIPRVPATFGIECVPFYEFLHPGPEYIDFGIVLRYVWK